MSEPTEQVDQSPPVSKPAAKRASKPAAEPAAQVSVTVDRTETTGAERLAEDTLVCLEHIRDALAQYGADLSLIRQQFAEASVGQSQLIAQVDALAQQQKLHGQLLVAQAELSRDLRGLLDQFGPALQKWSASPAARIAGVLRRGGAPAAGERV